MKYLDKDKFEMENVQQNEPFPMLEKDFSIQDSKNPSEKSGSISNPQINYINKLTAISRDIEDTKKIKRSLQRSRKLLKANKNILLGNEENKKKMKPSYKLTEKINSGTLYCFMCDMKFDNVELLLEHKEKNGFICRVCTSEFKCHAELETHFFQHNVLKCKTCREEFICMKDLLLHRQKMHRFNLFECKLCNRKFSRNSGLEKHILLQHSQSEHNQKCIVCGNSYKFPFQLKSHLETAHVPYEHIECGLCHNIYFGPDRLKSHVRMIHLDSDTNTPISCLTCGKIFSREQLLTRHLETHDDTVGLCEICGLSIKGKSAMKCHMYREHPKQGTFICKICNEQFSVKKLLRRHYKMSHYKKCIPMPMYCEICGKVYKTSAILNKHKLTHSSERPFKCEICGASFKQSVTLSLHSRVHSNVGKYCCSRCEKTFKWKQTFDKHVSKCGAIVGH